MDTVLKTCTKCNLPLPPEEFYLKDKKSGRRFSWCRLCHAMKCGRQFDGPVWRQKPVVVQEHAGECKTCGIVKPRSEFPVKSRHCTNCVSLYDKKAAAKAATKRYEERNPGSLKRNLDKYRSNNREKIRAGSRERYKKDPSLQKKHHQKYASTHKHAINAQTSRRRAKKLNALGYHNAADWVAILGKYGEICLKCGRMSPHTKITKDHVVPLTRGGSEFPDNLAPLCYSCNSTKRDRFAEYRPDHLLPSPESATMFV